MIYALQRIQTQMGPELKKWGIELNPEGNAILYQEKAKVLNPYTETRVCMRIIKEMIKDAKQRKAAVQAENQTSLLGGLERTT